MAKPDIIFFLIQPKKTEYCVVVCHCEMCAMSRTKDSSTYAKHTNVQEKESSIVNDCNVLKNGKVCFSENNNLWQMNFLQYRTPQFPKYVSNRVCDTHTRTHTCACEGWELSVVTPFAKHIKEREGKVEKFREFFSLDSVWNKYGQRLDRFYVLLVQFQLLIHSLPMSSGFLLFVQLQLLIHLPPVSSSFRLHTHAFRSLLRVFMHYPRSNTFAVRTRNCRMLQRHFRDVAQRPARITDNSLSRMTCAGSHLLSCNRQSAAIFCPVIGIRSRQRRWKRSKSKNIFGPYIPYGLFQTKGGDVCKVWFRSVQKCEFL
jgi:hypothetical protein